MPRSISLQHGDKENSRKSIKDISKELTHQLPKTIKHFFPKFNKSLRKIPDYRKRTDYELSEILMGGISMYTY